MTDDEYLGQDPAALSSAEDLDEDELRVDPLEKGVEPPEHWSPAIEHPDGESLGERLAEEEPDVPPAPEVPDDGGPARRSVPDDLPEEARRGQSADGGG